MPMPVPIAEKIKTFFQSKKTDEMFEYIESRLNVNAIDAQSLLDYVRTATVLEGRKEHYVVDAGMINQLGDVVGKLANRKQTEFRIEFYKLAAERNSAQGNYNCADLFFKKDLKVALTYINKAVELAVKISTQKNVLQNAYYLKAQCHEKLNEPAYAMKAYCEITDEKFQQYAEVIAARARLLKNQVHHDLTVKPDAHIPATPPIENASSVLPIEFSKKWSKETAWFHSADVTAIQAEYDARKRDIEQLITAKETEIALIKQLQKAETNELTLKTLIEKNQILENDLKTYRHAQQTLDLSYEKYFPVKRKILRRHLAESHFFNPTRSKKRAQLTELTTAFIGQRFRLDDKNLVAVLLTRKSARQIISAEKAFQNAAMNLTDSTHPTLGIPVVRNASWSVDDRAGENTYGPVEQYQVGATVMRTEHRTIPKRNRLGDTFFPDLRSYDKGIYPFLKKLSDEDTKKEQQLATWMIRFGKTHQPISLEELKTVYVPATKEDVDNMHLICFLIMDKEQGQWLSATAQKFQLGMSVSQARCLILLKEGVLSFKDAFINNPIFGVYSNTITLPTKI